MFPSNPNINDSHTEQGKNFIYNGEGWLLQSDLILPDGSKWENSGLTQIIPKDSKHIPVSIVDDIPAFGNIITHDTYEFATALTTDQNYVSDAELTVLQNTSGTNTGNETRDTIGTLIETTELSTVTDTTKFAISDSKFLKWVAGLSIYTYLKGKFDLVYQPLKNALELYVSQSEKDTWNAKQNSLGFTPEDIANKNVNNGYAPLDSGGKVPLANLPSTLLKYIGQWDASTNTPALINPDATKKGYVYDVSVAGTQFGLTFAIGDWLIYNDSGIPEKSLNSDNVISVNGQTGAVTITASGLGASTDIHSNITALNAVSGTNTGDQDLSGLQPTITPTADTTPVDTDYVITQRGGVWLRTLVSDWVVKLATYFGRLSTVNTWALLQTFTSGVKTGKIQPITDSTTAIQFTKADGVTPVMTVDSNNGNVGIGTTSLTAQLTQASVAANESAVLGSELTTSSGWSSDATWTGTYNSFTHVAGAGNTTALTNTLAAVTNNLYQISFTVTGRTAGSFYITFGGVNSGSYPGTNTWGPKTISTGTLSITPTSDFNGTIAISIKQITAAYSPTYVMKNSVGNSYLEIRSTTNGLNNQFIGVGAGRFNTTGYNNTANGMGALQFNTTGYNNTANGMSALYSNTTGTSNTANGMSALSSNTTGNQNTANGVNALQFNTTGYNNTANGMNALQFNTTGYNNTANGMNALYSNTTGNQNTANGINAGRFIADGVTANQTSNNSVYEGYNAMAQASGDTNEIVIGASAIGNGSNTVTLGNTSIVKTILQGNVGIGTTAPKSKLDVNGGVRVADDTAAASANKVGTTRYRVSGTTSYYEICIQTGATTFIWDVIKTYTW